ncbi:MAG: restriction endonuclease [Aciduliprofundum sp.]|nr:MAG: restriction endonuclease [Aciduliprofundum sp.]
MADNLVFYKETEFKDTEIGKIPKEWEIVKLGNIISLEYGKGLPQSDRLEGDIPVVGSNGIVGFHNMALTKGPGIVIGRKGTIGAVSWIDKDYWPIDTTYYVKTKRSDIFLRWLFYVLLLIDLTKLHLADVVPGLKRELVYSQKLPLPPFSEQQQIASILSTIDEAIQKTDEVIAKTERLKKGMMQELLTKGIGHKEFKDTEIGKIPKEWEIVRFQEICEKLKSGGTPSTKKPQYYNGDILFVKIEDITNARKYLYSTSTTITKEGLNNSTAWLIPKNSLLLAIYGSLGSVAINRIEVSTNQAILGIVLKRERAETEFFYYLFSNLNLKKFAKQTTQANLTADIIRKLYVPLPPLPEQQQIASILLAVDNKLELLRKERTKLETLKKGFMDELLTGKIRMGVRS